MSLLKNYLHTTAEQDQKPAAIAYLAALDHLKTASPIIAQAIIAELHDQRTNLKLIASENYSSLSVQLAMGNLLTDKYAEGYPQHRFYAGCANIDTVECEAENQLKKLFEATYAYVQPHSGADANLVAFWSILMQRVQTPEVEKLGKKTIDELSPEEYERVRQLILNQKMMGLSLNSGGHLTHGYRHNMSSKMMRAVHYDVDPATQLLDYDAIAQQAKEEKPTILLAGYSAYPRKIDFAKMREIADSVGAVFMVDMAHFSGLVAGKVFKDEFNPVPYAQIVTSTTHKTLRGPRGGFILAAPEFADYINKGCPLVLGGPLPHVMAAKAIAFQEANRPDFQLYAAQIVKNAQALAAALQRLGIKLVTDGTDNHLMILDLTALGLTGRHAENALRTAGLTVNRNAIPFDKNGPWYTSGVRIGTPSITTLGMKEPEMEEIASILADVLLHIIPDTVQKTGLPSKANCHVEETILKKSKERVSALLNQYPLYQELTI